MLIHCEVPLLASNAKLTIRFSNTNNTDCGAYITAASQLGKWTPATDPYHYRISTTPAVQWMHWARSSLQSLRDFGSTPRATVRYTCWSFYSCHLPWTLQVAATTLLLYEVLITSGQEIRYIWLYDYTTRNLSVIFLTLLLVEPLGRR
jgi:hypothetical protein